jgi:hypothetical protein
MIGIFGTISDEKFELPECVCAIYKTNYLDLPFSEAKLRCREDLRQIIKNIAIN